MSRNRSKKALMICCFSGYYNRTKYIYQTLKELGYEVTFIISDYDHMTKQRVVHDFQECEYVHVIPYKRNLSLARLLSHLSFGRAAKKYLNRLKPDFVYAKLPPNCVGRCCTSYKRNNKHAQLISDVIDLWPESFPIPMLNRLPFASVWQSWRDRCLMVSDYIITECDLFKDKLSYLELAEKVDTIHLCKEQSEEAKELVRQCVNERNDGIIAKELHIGYLGSINSIIDIDTIIRVIDVLIGEDYRIVLHIVGEGSSREELCCRSEQAGAKVQYYGKVFDDCERIRILAKCDFAINMMRDSSQVGLTYKSIDYFSMGIPLLNNIKGDTWELVDRLKVGINISDANQLKDSKILRDVATHEEVLDCFETYFSPDEFKDKFRAIVNNVVM